MSAILALLPFQACLPRREVSRMRLLLHRAVRRVAPHVIDVDQRGASMQWAHSASSTSRAGDRRKRRFRGHDHRTG